ncbi:hypothetical protein WS105_0151 [Weissella ceti]|uniref:Uncharacterized protein n=2 Tax=Weissella TaxID=46255 RepID=A0A075TY02_9LACO|nr:hypothetical protein WS08_0151 [Weissella tructae]AIM62404.1 hypothetical protein WS74_0152 [Weissella ceti]AIM63741.1 hypothetical protein WS105_0151 [Weissella ceti]ELA07927.1 hypothetical protein WCNC_00495 [Weissella ceti NC36]
MIFSVISTLAINLILIIILFYLILYTLFELKFIKNEWIIIIFSALSATFIVLNLSIQFISNNQI